MIMFFTGLFIGVFMAVWKDAIVGLIKAATKYFLSKNRRERPNFDLVNTYIAIALLEYLQETKNQTYDVKSFTDSISERVTAKLRKEDII